MKEILGRCYVGRDGFLIWAVGSWPELAAKVKLPRRGIQIVPGTGSIATDGKTPDVCEAPGVIEQLRVMYAAERRKRMASDEALRGKQHDLTEVQRRNAELEAKFTKKRNDGRDAQRKGGRGR